MKNILCCVVVVNYDLQEEKSSKKRSSSQLRKTFMEIFLSPEIKISHRWQKKNSRTFAPHCSIQLGCTLHNKDINSYIRRTLVSLFKHLDEVQKHESKNMMGFQNLAIVVSQI